MKTIRFNFRILKKKSSRCVTTIQLVLSVVIMSSLIYLWASHGCIGYSDNYLCRSYTVDYFFNSTENYSSVDDFTRLIDIENFTFLINNAGCNNSDLILLVLVPSHPKNFRKRFTVRTTWGKIRSGKFKLMFLLGATNDTEVQVELDAENWFNRDLIQGNFIDSYRNMTYKHIMGFKWTKYFCPGAKYLLKVDDDGFVNSPKILDYVSGSFGPLPQTGLILCRRFGEARAWRTYRSKWRVTTAEYKFRSYPSYCQGFAILYSFDVVETLYAKAQTSNYFWIDDVFVTGFLAQSANYSLVSFIRVLERDDYIANVKQKLIKSFPYFVGPWDLQEEDIRRLWFLAVNLEFLSPTKRFWA